MARITDLDNAILWVEPDDELPFARGGSAAPGPAFITRFEKGTSWGGDVRMLRDLLNPGDISRLVVLDTWIRNCDRYRPEPNGRLNRDNVFLAWNSGGRKGLTLKAIDHTHAFTCGRQLTKRLGQFDEVRDQTVFGRFPEFVPFLRREEVAACAAELSKMDAAKAAAVVGKVPNEWQVEEPVREAWARLIGDRAKFVAENIVSWLWPFGLGDDGR